jgi:hypothetical protein
VTSKALPDTEMEAAIDPVAVRPTSIAATAPAGIISNAKRRQRTRPVGGMFSVDKALPCLPHFYCGLRRMRNIGKLPLSKFRRQAVTGNG